jgi:hypothetical protein
VKTKGVGRRVETEADVVERQPHCIVLDTHPMEAVPRQEEPSLRKPADSHLKVAFDQERRQYRNCRRRRWCRPWGRPSLRVVVQIDLYETNEKNIKITKVYVLVAHLYQSIRCIPFDLDSLSRWESHSGRLRALSH